MRRMLTPLVPLLALAALGGCTSIAGIQEGKPYPDACKTVADCDSGVAGCRVAACEQERCVYVDAAKGTPLPMEAQNPGDCQEVQCNGAGQTQIVLVPADVPNDNEPCTVDVCIGSTPTHQNLESIPCYTGSAETEHLGNCRGGVQKCENGKAVGACLGERTPGVETCLTIFDDDCDGEVNESGTGCVCVPGTLGVCYPGTQETLGNQPCAAGKQVCNALGTAYESCADFTVPKPETCDASGVDEDCDGRINEEGSDCSCGDGIVSNDEMCDDKNNVDSDGCTNACKIPNCGDGIVTAGEECDDGDSDNTDECTTLCKQARCGDGFLAIATEQCDDGDLVAEDGCSATCTVETAAYACAPSPCQTAADCLAPLGGCVAATCIEGTCGCQLLSGVECRASAGICDIAESCDGVSANCPADTHIASGTQCRASADACDAAETCDGVNPNCPMDTFAMVGTPCRPAVGVCDIEEVCNGVSPACPPDALASAQTTCRPAADLCDAAEMCNGFTKVCPPDQVMPAGAICRSNVGPCDMIEVCDGVAKSCPADGLLPQGTECRPAAGFCDISENCNGQSPLCPADSFKGYGFTCRDAAGVCDVTETCDGTGPNCPSDMFVRSSSKCYARSGTKCISASICNGTNASCVPDPGVEVYCESAFPLTFVEFDRTFTITGANVNNTGTSVAIVGPGAIVPFSITGTWTKSASPICPACMTQFYARTLGVFGMCRDVSVGNGGTLNQSTMITAPMTPGVYVINALAGWDVGCSGSTATSPFTSPRTIGTLIVQ